MALKDLTSNDFQFYKQKAKKIRDCHEREFIKHAEPELMRLFYRGRNTKEWDADKYFDEPTVEVDKKQYMALSRMFTATNTVIPNLYYQNPRAIVVGKRNSTIQSAALLSSALNYYRGINRAKLQNQEAVMNAWFFGYGVKKVGYRTVLTPSEAIAQEPETIIDKVMGAFGMGEQPKPTDNLQSSERPNFVDEETLFNDSESPMNVMLDDKSSMMNCQAILHRVKRSLYELQNFAGGYDPEAMKKLEEKLTKSSGSRMDSRDMEVDLNELHIKQRNGIWILTWCDQYDFPLRYEKQDADLGGNFAFDFLHFDNEPGVRYPVAHMKVASQVQSRLDDMATLFLEIVGRTRNQILLNQKKLAPGQINAIKNNLTGGVILTNTDISPSVYAQLTSAAVSNDLPMLMSLVQQNLTEIMGADEQMVSGKSKNDTLGQDELARVGTKIRESGMLDRIKDFEIAQLRKEASLLQQYSSAQMFLEITKQDFYDKQKVKDFQDTWAEFMTQANPLGLKHYIQGFYDFDVNTYEAVRPDKTQIMKECLEATKLYGDPVIQNAMLMRGAVVRIDLLAEKMADQFEYLRGSEFIEHLNPMQLAVEQAKQVVMQNGGQVPGSLTAQDKLKGAEKVDGINAKAESESVSQEKVTKPSASGATK